MLKPGDLVKAISGGPVMMIEADRGNGEFTFTWFEGERPRSIVLPGPLVRPMPSESQVTDAAHRLPQAVVDLDKRMAVLEEKVDSRGYNTRPMYEVHEEKIQQLEARIERLEQGRERSEEPTKEF